MPRCRFVYSCALKTGLGYGQNFGLTRYQCKDIFVFFQIPDIEEKAVDAYLAQFDKKLNEKTVNMYKERFLLSAPIVV